MSKSKEQSKSSEAMENVEVSLKNTIQNTIAAHARNVKDFNPTEDVSLEEEKSDLTKNVNDTAKTLTNALTNALGDSNAPPIIAKVMTGQIGTAVEEAKEEALKAVGKMKPAKFTDLDRNNDKYQGKDGDQKYYQDLFDVSTPNAKTAIMKAFLDTVGDLLANRFGINHERIKMDRRETYHKNLEFRKEESKVERVNSFLKQKPNKLRDDLEVKIFKSSMAETFGEEKVSYKEDMAKSQNAKLAYKEMKQWGNEIIAKAGDAKFKKELEMKEKGAAGRVSKHTKPLVRTKSQLGLGK